MPIPVTCGGCGHTMDVPDAHAGKRGRCKRCGEVVRVPSPELVAAFGFAAGADSDSDSDSDGALPLEPGPVWDPAAMAARAEADAEAKEFPPLDVLGRPPVTRAPAPVQGREPWYYRVLVIYAYLILGLGLAIAIPMGVIMLGLLAEGGRHASLVALAIPLAIGFGSAVTGAPILLGVDLARNVRVIRWRADLVGR